jgi:hypothetical protein
MKNEFEESGRGLIAVVPAMFLEQLKKNHSQDSLFLEQDSNRAPSYTSLDHYLYENTVKIRMIVE